MPPPFFKEVPTNLAYSFDEIYEIKDYYLSQGYEGIIVRKFYGLYVRKRSTEIVKLKPKKKDTYPIVGFKEEVSIEGLPKGSLGALICSCEGEQFSVGIGFTEQERKVLWKLIQEDSTPFLNGNLSAEIEYQNITAGSARPSGKGVPRCHFSCKIVVTEKEAL